MADKKSAVRELFRKAIEDGDQSKAEGIASCAAIFDPEIDLKKSAKPKTDNTVELSAEEEHMYEQFLDAAGVREKDR